MIFEHHGQLAISGLLMNLCPKLLDSYSRWCTTQTHHVFALLVLRDLPADSHGAASHVSQVGGKRRLYIPGDLAFPKGLASAPGRPRIPPNSPVVFDVDLLYIPGLDFDEEDYE